MWERPRAVMQKPDQGTIASRLNMAGFVGRAEGAY